MHSHTSHDYDIRRKSRVSNAWITLCTFLDKEGQQIRKSYHFSTRKEPNLINIIAFFEFENGK